MQDSELDADKKEKGALKGGNQKVQDVVEILFALFGRYHIRIGDNTVSIAQHQC